VLVDLSLLRTLSGLGNSMLVQNCLAWSDVAEIKNRRVLNAVLAFVMRNFTTSTTSACEHCALFDEVAIKRRVGGGPRIARIS